MAWTQTQLDALDAAIATGTRRVTFADGTREFHSLDEMLKLRATMKREINPPRTHRLASISKGV